MSHGTNAGYVAGCRLACCRTAHADYKRHLRAVRYLRRADRLYIDASPTHRRIQALIAIGWTYRRINAEAGWATTHPGGNAHNVMRQRAVHIDTAAKIDAVYERLHMVIPTGPYVARQRRIAATKGWLVPLAWEDIDAGVAATPDTTVDLDPVVVERILAGDWRLSANRAERAEVMRRWSGSLNELERRTGWNCRRDQRTEVA
jgi:hypothetical protein